MFCGSGHRGGALPASKVRSDLRTSPDTFGFQSLGGPHATPEPAPSALKEQRGCGRSILHLAGGDKTFRQFENTLGEMKKTLACDLRILHFPCVLKFPACFITM